MRVPLRIVIPIISAVILAAAVLGLAWWELQETTLRVQRVVDRSISEEEEATASGTPTADDVTPGDAVLLHLREGDLFALQGDWQDAEHAYEQAVAAGGGIPALRKLAQAQMQRREIDKVRGTIQALRRAGAREEDLLLLQTIVFLRTGELVKAQQLLEKAPDSPQKHYGLALLLIVQGKHDQAKRELQATIDGWDPTLRSYARTLKASYDEFALFPESPPLHLTTLLARGLAHVQECELALPLLAGVIEQQSDYRDAWTVQGYCELTTERPTEALSSFERAYAIDPEKPEIQYFLGRTYMTLKQWHNAVTFLQYALVNGFDPPKEVRMKLADAAMEAGDKSLALEQLKVLLIEPDADLALYERTILLALELEKNDDAEQIALSATKKWPESERAKELLRNAQQKKAEKVESSK